MKTMTEKEIAKDWDSVQRNCREYVSQREAEAIFKYCKGNDIKTVARATKLSNKTIQNRLDLYGMSIATGGGRSDRPLEARQREADKLIDDYGPSESDAEAFEPYVEHYTQQDYTPAIATRLAKAEWAAEEAVEAGVIKEDTSKQDARVHRILFPEEKQTSEQLQFETHMSNVKRAATFLGKAKVGFLKKESTRKAVASAHAKWLEEADHICALNQPSVR